MTKRFVHSYQNTRDLYPRKKSQPIPVSLQSATITKKMPTTQETAGKVKSQPKVVLLKRTDKLGTAIEKSTKRLEGKHAQNRRAF